MGTFPITSMKNTQTSRLASVPKWFPFGPDFASNRHPLCPSWSIVVYGVPKPSLKDFGSVAAILFKMLSDVIRQFQTSRHFREDIHRHFPRCTTAPPCHRRGWGRFRAISMYLIYGNSTHCQNPCYRPYHGRVLSSGAVTTCCAVQSGCGGAFQPNLTRHRPPKGSDLVVVD